MGYLVIWSTSHSHSSHCFVNHGQEMPIPYNFTLFLAPLWIIKVNILLLIIESLHSGSGIRGCGPILRAGLQIVPMLQSPPLPYVLVGPFFGIGRNLKKNTN